MPHTRDRLLRPAALLTMTLWLTAATACNVPVFRYALERWEADPYQIVVFHRGQLTAEQQAVVETLEKAAKDGSANLVLNSVDLTQDASPPMRALWNAQENPSPPWMVVRYPEQTGIERPAWSGPFSAEAVGALLESPARREIAQKLLRGDAIVWLLLESSDQGRDDDTGQLIEAELRSLEKSLVLPEASPLDPPTNPNLPLKIAFSTVRVARSLPAERMLVNLLLNWNTNLAARTEVMLFPVFGRGRVIPPAIGEQIRAEAIRDMAEFLTGPCSCEVKMMNPGYDLLLAANWNSLAGADDLAPSAPPPLIGLSQFAAGARTNLSSRASQPAVSLGSAGPSAAPANHDRLFRNLAVVLSLSVTFFTVATLLLKAKASRRP